MLTPTARDGHWPSGRTGVDLGPIPRAPTHRSRFALLLTAPNLALALERTSLRGLLVADDRLWGSAPHSSSSPIRPRPLIVCLRQTSGTAAPGHFRSLPLGLQKGAAAGRVGPGRPQRRRRATPMTTQSIATPRQHCAIAQVRPSVLRSRRLAALPRRGRA